MGVRIRKYRVSFPELQSDCLINKIVSDLPKTSLHYFKPSIR